MRTLNFSQKIGIFAIFVLPIGIMVRSLHLDGCDFVLRAIGRPIGIVRRAHVSTALGVMEFRVNDTGLHSVPHADTIVNDGGSFKLDFPLMRIGFDVEPQTLLSIASRSTNRTAQLRCRPRWC